MDKKNLLENKFIIKAPGLSFRKLRQNDCFIMDKVNYLNISTMDKVRLNLCRIYLQALTISDITDAGGVRLLDSALKGNRDTTRTSTLCWPNQGRPCEQDWRLWRYHITRIFAHPRHRVLQQPLGTWIALPHQQSTWWFDIETQHVYHKQGQIFVQYSVEHPNRPVTRSGMIDYLRRGVILGQAQNELCECTVISRTRDRVSLLSIARQHNQDRPFFITPPIHAHDFAPYYHFRYYSDQDDGTILHHKLLMRPSILVGDGSYERKDDSGAASFIWECDDATSRASNATCVPSNPVTSLYSWNDPY